MKAESRASYQKSTNPAPITTTPKGTTKPIDPEKPEVEKLRKELDDDKWVRRSERQETTFSKYRTQPLPQTRYDDNFSNMWFWLWLLDHNNQSQSREWAYNHKKEMI